MIRVFLSLGSNIDPETHLLAAVRQLQSHPDLTLVRASTVWESAAVGFADQPRYCNAAVLLETHLPAEALKWHVLRDLESRLGRVRDPKNRNAPRTIDLDIAFYGSQVIDRQGLEVPDPDITSRPFLAVPLAELDPKFVHPVLQLSLREISQSLGGASTLTARSDIDLQRGLAVRQDTNFG